MTYSNKPPKSSLRLFFEYLMLLLAIGGLGIWIFSWASSAAFQYWANRILEHSSEHRTDSSAETAKPQPLHRTLPDGALVGRLEIPRLHVQSVVREGVGNMTLSLAVGHIPGTALPGDPGNVAVAGHRDTFFRALRGIGKNDVIRFNAEGNTYVYQVESTQIVKPQDVEVLKPGPHSELTLVTCYPFYYIGSAPDRFIVKAKQIAQIMSGDSNTSAVVLPVSAPVAPPAVKPRLARHVHMWRP